MDSSDGHGRSCYTDGDDAVPDLLYRLMYLPLC